MKLGPEKFDKIAVMGTAGTSMELAPFKDPSWAIWACSPGAFPLCAKNRSDAWFEPHRWLPTSPGQMGAPGTRPWFSPEFNEFLAAHKGPVFMTGDPQTRTDESYCDDLLKSYGRPQDGIPNSVPIPYGYLIKKYGPYFWTSTLSYMLAMAIEELAPRAEQGEQVAIGLFGVDMAASEEWAYQRPGCQHFIGLAMSIGINIVLPPESDLMQPCTMYGIGEHNPRHIRLLAKKVELEAHKAALTQQMQAAQQQLLQVSGGIESLDYVLNSWCDEVESDLRQAVSFAGESKKPVGHASQLGKISTGATVLDLPTVESGKH